MGEPQYTADGVLQVASLDDLMATKLKVILQRAEVKDYFDIIALIKAGVCLDYGLRQHDNYSARIFNQAKV